MNRPLVSIVTPSLNQGRFIEQTILSVRGQTYPHLEHIVMDAGSRDETVAILKKYEGTYSMRWVSEPDRGMYDGINKGFQSARGEILAYLNTDDWYLPWTVETIVNYFSAHPEINLVFGDHLDLYENGRVGLSIQPSFRFRLIRTTPWSLPQPTVFWRRKVYEALGGFDSGFQFCGDSDFWIRAGLRFKIGQIREVLALVQLHSDQKTTANEEKIARELGVRDACYSTPEERTPWRRFFEIKLYAWFWQRVFMAKFLLHYLVKKWKQIHSSAWSFFLALDGLALAPWTELAAGFFPFGHRGAYKWTLCGKVWWDQKGFHYQRNP